MSQFVAKALRWAASFEHFFYFTNNNIAYPYNGFEHRLCVGAATILEGNKLEILSQIEYKNRYWCGYVAYNLKNQIELLHSSSNATIPFPNLGFVAPLYVITFGKDTAMIDSEEVHPQVIFETIINIDLSAQPKQNKSLQIIATVNHETYLQQIEKIKQHLWQGDIYEMNYCIEFTASAAALDYIDIFSQLNQQSPMPFAVLAKTPNGVVMCASPERFLKKQHHKIISQPIKGTMRRSPDAILDEILKNQLRNSEKEQAENMMIVDLMRSDLAKIATIGSVMVTEMFEVYSFKQVHQMISTVVADLKPEINLQEIFKATFPMGSMTGAPKISAMKLIDELEATNRGIYSGAIGMISPNGDFDFNVVIRSIVYHPSIQQLSFHVGSAITTDSIAEQEYEECMLKAKAIFEVLKGNDK